MHYQTSKRERDRESKSFEKKIKWRSGIPAGIIKKRERDNKLLKNPVSKPNNNNKTKT